MPDVVTPALVGLAVNYTLLVPIYLNWVVKFAADMEMYMTAVERLDQYANLPSEEYKEHLGNYHESSKLLLDVFFSFSNLSYNIILVLIFPFFKYVHVVCLLPIRPNIYINYVTEFL
jgi:hypothetical protein